MNVMLSGRAYLSVLTVYVNTGAVLSLPPHNISRIISLFAARGTQPISISKNASTNKYFFIFIIPFVFAITFL